MELTNEIEHIISNNQDTLNSIIELYKNDEEPTESDPRVAVSQSQEYNNVNLDIDLYITYTGESHKFEPDKGHFNFDLRIRMDDSEILTDIKKEMYDLSDHLFPEREAVVTQDYPSHRVRIDYELDEEQLRSSLIRN